SATGTGLIVPAAWQPSTSAPQRSGSACRYIIDSPKSAFPKKMRSQKNAFPKKTPGGESGAEAAEESVPSLEGVARNELENGSGFFRLQFVLVDVVGDLVANAVVLAEHFI